MPDVTLWDIAAGVKTTWASVSALTAIIPAASVYRDRQPESATLPYVVYTFEDISAFFGGTEYFSGPDYVKQTRVLFEIYGHPETDFAGLARAMGDNLGWGQGNPSGQWDIDNAEVLSSMPETEKIETLTERIDQKDVIKYSSSFTLKMQATRG